MLDPGEVLLDLDSVWNRTENKLQPSEIVKDKGYVKLMIGSDTIQNLSQSWKSSSIISETGPKDRKLLRLLQGFVPKVVLQRFTSSTTDPDLWLAELRQVFMLFISLT